MHRQVKSKLHQVASNNDGGVLKDLVVFEAAVGELLACLREPDNDTLWEIFRMFNFCSQRRVQKLASYGNFSIYGSLCVSAQQYCAVITDGVCYFGIQ